jgi:hypothetical protein
LSSIHKHSFKTHDFLTTTTTNTQNEQMRIALSTLASRVLLLGVFLTLLILDFQSYRVPYSYHAVSHPEDDDVATTSSTINSSLPFLNTTTFLCPRYTDSVVTLRRLILAALVWLYTCLAICGLSELVDNMCGRKAYSKVKGQPAKAASSPASVTMSASADDMMSPHGLVDLDEFDDEGEEDEVFTSGMPKSPLKSKDTPVAPKVSFTIAEEEEEEEGANARV